MTPSARIAVQPWMSAPETSAVLSALTADGQTVRFVGGCVRDAVLGRVIKDVDLATPDPPETVIALIQRAGLRAVPTGIAHGTITAIASGRPFEITTLRRDVESYGRHAKVAFTDDWMEDAGRRDFTINAMFCDHDGAIYDFFGGLDDLAAGRVRFVGDARTRIEEDVLRLLRFFRFFAWYGRNGADQDGLEACRALAPRLPSLSGERVRDETLKLLGAPAPLIALGLIAEGGIFAHFLPEGVIAARRGFDRLGALIAIEAALDVVDGLRRLAALLAPEADAPALADRLRLSNAARDRLVAMVRPAQAIDPGWDARACRRALYRLGEQGFRDLALLAWAEARAQGRPEQPFPTMLEHADRWVRPDLPVRGADVLALGFERGPAVGDLLDSIERWWIDGDFSAGRAEALARLKAIAGDGETMLGASAKNEGP